MKVPYTLSIALSLTSALVAGCGSSQPKVQPAVFRPVPAIIPGRPTPIEKTFRGCPPIGSTSEDPFINLLKNRIDRPAHPTLLTYLQIENLEWPVGVTDVVTARWPKQARAQIFRHDGAPVTFVGYIATADNGGKEPANCNQPDAVDWHMWLGASPHLPHIQTFIAEVGPRIRARERGFSLSRLDKLATHGNKVRITGWLMFDSEHPEQPTNRSTIWEIHPITSIDVWTGNRWQHVAG